MISIVIPNYNGEDNLKRNLPKIEEAIRNYQGDSEILIVDDASTDESLVFIKLFCQNKNNSSRFILNSKNLGFGETCNVGVKNAQGEIVVLLNSDVYPEKNFLKFLVPHFADDKIFGVGCFEKTMNEKNEVISERGAGKIFFKDGIFQHSAGDLNSNITDWVCGGSGAFRKDLYLKLGGFDKRFYPFYWEDVDLSYCATQEGYKLIFENRSIVFHQHIKGSIATKYSKNEIEKISFSNQIKFTKKHLNSFNRFFSFHFFLIKLSIRNILGKYEKSNDQK
jgi:O-antigen biosynthesis protein